MGLPLSGDKGSGIGASNFNSTGILGFGLWALFLSAGGNDTVASAARKSRVPFAEVYHAIYEPLKFSWLPDACVSELSSQLSCAAPNGLGGLESGAHNKDMDDWKQSPLYQNTPVSKYLCTRYLCNKISLYQNTFVSRHLCIRSPLYQNTAV